MMKMMNR